MTAYPPQGFRYDTFVPGRCPATDLELQAHGAAACPASSRIGGGTTDGVWMGVFRSKMQVTVLNAKDEQIFLVGTPGFASISRGRIADNGSITFASPTCFPDPGPAPCVVDNALQLGSSIKIARYTRTIEGRTRSYMTTAPCPPSHYWRTPIRFWWADGSKDTVVAKQRCARPGPETRRSRPRRKPE